MKSILPITFTLGLVPLGANASDLEIRTISGGVLCTTAFQLRKATVAANRGDDERVRQLGCIRTSEGTKAVLSDQITAPFGPWQVWLKPDGDPPLAMWGYASSFKPIPALR